jgi:predicted nucleic acid-binding Zn ribbon protein
MTHYLVCRNCGKYVRAGDIVHRTFCSEDCTRIFSTCVNCGAAFPKGKGFDGEYCSRECTVKYQIFRKYGPQPVTVVAET